ncbi:sperm-associated antigen 5 isoform X2 [Kryptolebias marmoratus]|nr:sperm-associated antigen 5 isoform X2 [Kryptolebias marmoratus]
MSSRKSGSSGEDLSSSRYGERTPLRSLNNEILHMSTPSSRLKSKSQLGGDAGKMGDSLLCDSEPHLLASQLTKTILTHPDGTQTGSGLGDVTYKSFICAGGEVEDSVISHSLMEQSCCDHIEHPYYNPNVKQPHSVGISAVNVCEVSGSAFSFGDVDGKEDAQDLESSHADCSEEKRVTLKSFVCFGGEVELSDTTRLHEETIPLPVTDVSNSSQHNDTYFVNSSDDSTQLCQVEHVDHPYCGGENGKTPAFTTFPETTKESETLANELNGLTLESFNCTGGEAEVPASSELLEETLPLTFSRSVSGCESHRHSVDQSVDQSALAGDDGVQNSSDHPYCTIKNRSTSQEGFSCSSRVVGVERMSLLLTEGRDVAHEGSVILPAAEDGKSDDDQDLETFPAPPQAQWENCPPVDDSASTSLTQDRIERANSHLETGEVVESPADIGSSPTNASLKAANNVTVKYEVQEVTEHSEDSVVPSVVHGAERSGCSRLAASAESPAHQGVQERLDHLLQVCFPNGPPESSEGQDSALGSSANGPAFCSSTEKPAEDLPDVLKVLSECPSVPLAVQLGLLSPIVKRASLSLLKTPGNLPLNRFLADNFALEGDKSLVSHINADPSKLWAEHMGSPMPRPLFNSTAVGYKSQPGSATKQKADSGGKTQAVPQSEDAPLIPEGQLQQQLRQMAEFLILASGQMGATGASAPPPAVFAAPSRREPHSVCVGTSPPKLTDRSLNTSGTFVRKRELSVVDSCTETDPLIWNLAPGSLGCLSREELEQRLMSGLIMVEALVQQLAAARAQGPVPAGPAPSDLREKLVQTDHTELSQTTMYRDLYVEALSRISELELDGRSLQDLVQSVEDTRASMVSLSGDADAALSNVNEWRDAVGEDRRSLVSHYQRVESLFDKWKEMQARMKQKVKKVLQEREDMRTEMEEAFAAKDAAFGAMEQLRTHCAADISALEKSVGSQQELLAALSRTYPEQVALNEACGETLSSASDLLSHTMEEHSSLMNELHAVRSLLQKAAPVLLLLNEKTAAALAERDEHRSARDRAVEEREQLEEELRETHLNLQAARQHIGDLNLQVTILSSEMGVLRQKLSEKEEESGQLERKATELSATISSTLASYTFLEQALAAETTKLQQSWKDIQQANERANQLTASLEESEGRERELSRALAQSEDRVGQLQTLSQSQALQLQQLQEVCAQLSGVQEMNEFLQMENELAREQVAESERMLRTNLQALRERNIECEDLRGEVCRLQDENRNLRDELKTMGSAADAARTELGEKMAEAVTGITLLHHTLRGLTDELHAALSEQKQDQEKESEVLCGVERRHPSSSFVDSVMVALSAEKGEDVRTDSSAASDPPEPQGDTLFSESSAFTCIAALTPGRNPGVEVEEEVVEEEEERQSGGGVAELLAGLSSTVSELAGALESVRRHKDAQLQELHANIRGLQVEQQAASGCHQAEVLELKQQLSRLKSQAERGNQVLQQKAQDEKTLTKLMVDVREAQEILTKHKTDNNELRKEVAELRRALQQSRVESQLLQDELRKSGGRSADAVHHVEEKIQLLKEMERLKASLQEAEQARGKLLERAKRHQLIHQTNVQKSQKELQMLNNMMNKVRETLQSLPEVMKSCERLQELIEYIG